MGSIILYLLYGFIIAFVAIYILNYLAQKKVTTERNKLLHCEYTHVNEDIAPKVTGAGGGYAVILKDVQSSKQISIINVIRMVTDLSLKDAKILMESAPVVIIENISNEEAQRIKDELEKAGAIVEIKEI